MPISEWAMIRPELRFSQNRILFSALEVDFLPNRRLAPKLDSKRHRKAAGTIRPHCFKVFAIRAKRQHSIVARDWGLPFLLNGDDQLLLMNYVAAAVTVHFHLNQCCFRRAT